VTVNLGLYVSQQLDPKYVQSPPMFVQINLFSEFYRDISRTAKEPVRAPQNPIAILRGRVCFVDIFRNVWSHHLSPFVALY
jgi:hypothetical protein